MSSNTDANKGCGLDEVLILAKQLEAANKRVEELLAENERLSTELIETSSAYSNLYDEVNPR